MGLNGVGAVLQKPCDNFLHVSCTYLYNWYWLVDGLMDSGYRVHLANTAAIFQYEGLKYTNDDSDARWLAKLLRLGLLLEGYIYPKKERALRDLLWKRSQLVRQRTSNLLSVQNLLARNCGDSLGANAIKRLTFGRGRRVIAGAPPGLGGEE